MKHLSMQLAVVAAAVCLCLVDGAPGGRMVRAKQQRPTRGFKNVEMMTARGFGKRDRPASRAEHQDEYRTGGRRRYNPKSSLMVAPDFGKRSGDNDDEVYGMDNFWEMLEASPEKEGQENDDKIESIPLDWFVNEMVTNPDFARSVVRKFMDLNQDGVLTADELLRNMV